MKALSSTFAEAYASWLSSISQCCVPLTPSTQQDKSDQSSLEKSPVTIVRHQPGLVQPPLADFEHDPFRPSTRASAKDRVRKSFSSNRTSLSLRKRFRSSSSTRGRRPQISAPSNFVHVHSESFQFPEVQPAQPRRTSFRPLQLSIYQSENGLSPILPYLDPADRVITPPPPARVRGAHDDDGRTLKHERSYSSMSFHIPRRGAPEDSPRTPPQNRPPQIPPKSRARAYTSPESEELAERIASALLEKEKLQELIDEVVERQSIYLGGSSRPSTAHSMAFTMTDMEPMPAIPALPPSAPSFAERLNPGSDRPNTAPTRSPVRPRYFDEPPTALSPRTPTRITAEDRPLQPPLPLVLRPPLRKKKSFSRVSTWLFPAGEHQRDLSFDSITNQPRPVKGREGFYQCVSPSPPNSRPPTVSSVSSWATEDDERTVPTTWSPSSSPATKSAAEQSSGTLLDRMATFGSRQKPILTPKRPDALAGETAATTGPRRESVGVAF